MRYMSREILRKVYPKISDREKLEYLEQAITTLQDEIKINESCRLRTNETEQELKKLYDAKFRIKKHINKKFKERGIEG